MAGLSLLQLISNIAGVDTPSGGPAPAPNDENQIVVQGGRKEQDPSHSINYPDAPDAPTLTNGPTPPDLGNRSYIEAAQAANSNAPKHGGTLRSILGILGDAFLVQGGAKPVYAEKRQQEQEGDALQGFTADPLAAIERLAQRNPKAAADLWDNLQKNLYNQGQLKSSDANRQSSIENRNFDNKDKGMTRIQQWAYGGMPYDKIAAGAQMYGINPNDLQSMGITPDMTPEDRKQFAYGAMSVNQQVQVPFTERRTASGEVNAEAHMKNANRPPRPAQPRATTNVQTYVGDDGYQYTQRSDGTVVKSPTKVRPTKGGNGRRSISPAPSSGWGSVTRN